ncbi:nicotinamide riboside transporter PnuC [Marinimicrobium locisalis]|uniref:nicotinamide riboside transporter PnuC n=1 Tax=Marinimicrobium locisalis TaxID=546022 RepID=UPI003221C6BB
MISLQALEYGANAVYLISVFLAARNSIHTWWIGVVGCLLFGWLFYRVQLYAEVSLMGFYVVTSFIGWYHWAQGKAESAIRTTHWFELGLYLLAALVVTGLYGFVLGLTTDAFAPLWDSAVTLFSVLALFLMMHRRIECWWFWLIVNTLAIPLYLERELWVTAAVYTLFWFNAWYGFFVWHRQYRSALRNTSEPVSS